jgi:hypothetical protein
MRDYDNKRTPSDPVRDPRLPRPGVQVETSRLIIHLYNYNQSTADIRQSVLVKVRVLTQTVCIPACRYLLPDFDHPIDTLYSGLLPVD